MVEGCSRTEEGQGGSSGEEDFSRMEVETPPKDQQALYWHTWFGRAFAGEELTNIDFGCRKYKLSKQEIPAADRGK